MASDESLDVIIIGGGPAGLSAALGLARQRHTALVLDSGIYRNEKAVHMHTVLTWDHKDPKEFRAVGKENILARYKTIQFADAEAKLVERTSEGIFAVEDAHGKVWKSKKLVLASGSTDVFPDIDGYAESWGSGIFQCLFCHGYEEQGAASAGVLAMGACANLPHALHMARQIVQLTGKATIYTNGDKLLATEIESKLSDSQPIIVDKRTILRLKKSAYESEVILYFEDGTQEKEGFLAHKPKTQLNGPFAKQLALKLTPQGDFRTTPPFYQTNQRGIFACGDNGTSMKAITSALFTGSAVAAGVSGQLQADSFGHESIV